MSIPAMFFQWTPRPLWTFFASEVRKTVKVVSKSGDSHE
jgi:hypothetical protein